MKKNTYLCSDKPNINREGSHHQIVEILLIF